METETVQTSSTPASHSGEWLTTGEAYQIALSRGLEKSRGTFRRMLADLLVTGIMPPELERLGLIAYLDVRKRANPKDNSVRWLRFEK
jgi:hypothetical protein